MKRIFLGAVLLALVLTGVAALDQGLYFSVGASCYDLLDIKNPASLKTTVWPLASYSYGDANSNGIEGFAQVALPYQVGESLASLFPDIYTETFYRFGKPDAASFMQAGLYTQLGKRQTTGTTYFDVYGFCDYYLINKMQEIWTAYRYDNYFEGIRLGFGLEAGATFYDLLEGADLTATIHAEPTASMVAGTELFENFWVVFRLGLTLPTIGYNTFDKSFNYTFEQQGSLSCSFVQESFQIRAGLHQDFLVFDLYTVNGLFKDAYCVYDLNPWISFSCSIIEDLQLYVQPYLYIEDGYIGPLEVRVSVDYFLF